MHPHLNTAITAARDAGKIILKAYDRLDQIEITEKSQKNYVTSVDHAAEAAILKILQKAYPSHSILSEESGLHAGDDYQWIIDPLDGTHNFMHRLPHFCVSIALKYRGNIEQAVIYQPLLDELFTATRGQGAQRNHHKLRIPNIPLSKVLLGTALHSSADQERDFFHRTTQLLAADVLSTRRFGAAALDLAYVASGQLGAYWALGLQPWDTAAGSLLITEAGGVISDLKGGNSYLDGGPLIAGGLKIYRELLEKLK